MSFMKKMLLIIAGSCLLAEPGQAGISFGGIPGVFALDSLVSKPTTDRRVPKKPVVAGVADPGPRETVPSPIRGHRPRLQRRFATR